MTLRPLTHIPEAAATTAVELDLAATNPLAPKPPTKQRGLPLVPSFSGFGRPWALLADRVPDLAVKDIAMGAGYQASGSVKGDRSQPAEA